MEVTRCLKQKANRLESSSCSVCGGGGGGGGNTMLEAEGK